MKHVSAEHNDPKIYNNLMYYVYILRCKDSSLYTGITKDVKQRFWEHQKGKGGRYTRSHKPVRIVYSETHQDKSSALKREIEIKKLSRTQKIAAFRLVL